VYLQPIRQALAADHGHELPERFAPILLRPERSLKENARDPIDSRGQRSLIWAHEFRTFTSGMRTFRFFGVHPPAPSGLMPPYALGVCIAVFRRFEEANQRIPHRKDVE
jgi:hypothetical protein